MAYKSVVTILCQKEEIDSQMKDFLLETMGQKVPLWGIAFTQKG